MADAPSVFGIQAALATWYATRTRLLLEDGDLAQDEQQLAALLGSETEDLTEIETRLARAIVIANAMADTADTLAENLLARRDRYKRRVQSYKAAMLAIFEAVGIRRLETAEATITARAGPPAVIVTDESQIPDRFIRTDYVRRVDRVALREALADGEVIDGCQLSNGIPSLTIRQR